MLQVRNIYKNYMANNSKHVSNQFLYCIILSLLAILTLYTIYKFTFSLFPPNTGIFVVSTVIFYMNVHVRKIALGINFTEYQIILQMYFLVQIIFRAVCIYHDFKQIVLPFTILLWGHRGLVVTYNNDYSFTNEVGAVLCNQSLSPLNL